MEPMFYLLRQSFSLYRPQQPVHILIIPSWYRASQEDTQGSFFREQAFSLANNAGGSRPAAQVGIIHPQHRSMRQWQSVVTGRYGFDQEDDAGIPTLRMHTMTWFPRQVPYLNYWLWVRNGITLYRRYVEQFGRPDVIHAHGMMYGGLLAWNIKSLFDVPFVVTEHGTAYARKLFAPWELKVAAKAAAAADARLAVSEAFCEELSGYLGSTWRPCPNVVSSLFTDYPLPATASQPPFVFSTVAYLTKRKGIHHMIEAFAEVFGNDPDVLLKIGGGSLTGGGEERPYLEALAQSLGVADRVVFLGALNRTEVRDLMAQTDAFLLASNYETFGVVVIEALALGKPVIATRCGGPNQVVRPEDGVLIEPGDVAALAAAMRQMRADQSGAATADLRTGTDAFGDSKKDRKKDLSAQRRYDAQEIRDACIARYGEAALVERLRSIYDEVCGQRPPAEGTDIEPTESASIKESAAHYA